MPRSDIKQGPGVAIFNTSTTLFSKDDIVTQVERQISPTPSAVYGNVGDVDLDVKLITTMTPLGEWESLAVLFPYGAMVPGTSIFSDTDKPLKVHGLDGESLLSPVAAITKMPAIRCTPRETLFGAVEFTGIRAYDAAWSAANSLYTITSEAFASYSAFSKAAVLRVAFAAAWGSAPWNTIKTESGWEIDFDLQLKEVMDDVLGLVDIKFVDLVVRAKCTPIGKTITQILGAMPIQGGTARRGQSLVSTDNLVLTGAGGSPVITINKPAVLTAGMQWGAESLRNGEFGFIAQPTFTLGVKDALFTVA